MKRTRIECDNCENTACFVKKCNAEHLSVLSQKKNQLVLSKDQSVFKEGETVHGIYFIQHGKVKVTITENGKEQIVRLAGNGHILGHRGYGDETYPIGAMALDESRLCFLNNDILYEAFQNNFQFIYSMMMFYSKELRKSELRTKHFAQMTVEEKVIFTLIYIIETFGLGKNKEGISIALLSRQEIANIAGTNAEQVSRTIASLKKQGYISTQGNRIIVEKPKKLMQAIKHHIGDSFNVL